MADHKRKKPLTLLHNAHDEEFANVEMLDLSQLKRISNEGLMLGDVVHFHDSRGSGSHTAIRLGNKIAGCTGDDWSTIHTEMVIGIDKQENAIIGGAPGPDLPTRKILLQDFLKISTNIEGVSISRLETPALALTTAHEMESFINKQLVYSRDSCLISILPIGVPISKDTSSAPAMMCTELVWNAMHSALQLNSEYKITSQLSLRSRITPGEFRKSIQQPSVKITTTSVHAIICDITSPSHKKLEFHEEFSTMNPNKPQRPQP